MVCFHSEKMAPAAERQGGDPAGVRVRTAGPGQFIHDFSRGLPAESPRHEGRLTEENLSLSLQQKLMFMKLDLFSLDNLLLRL